MVQFSDIVCVIFTWSYRMVPSVLISSFTVLQLVVDAFEDPLYALLYNVFRM